MPKYGATSRRELIRGHRNLGFDGPFSGTKHEFMVRGSQRLRIPNPHGRDIGVDLLQRILQQAGITRDDWESV